MSKEELLRKRAALQHSSDQLWDEIDNHAGEEARISDVLENAEAIFAGLNNDFQAKTALTAADISILTMGAAIQAARIYLLPKHAQQVNRLAKLLSPGQTAAGLLSAGSDAVAELTMSADTLEVEGDFIADDPVADEAAADQAADGQQNAEAPESHLNKRGWIMDMARIICSTDKSDKLLLFSRIFNKAREVAPEQFELLSLPIPYLSQLDQTKALAVYDEGCKKLGYMGDTTLLKNTLVSASQSMVANMLVGALHTYFYNPEKDGSPEFYNIRTRKVIMLSNLIASSTDVAQTLVRSSVGDVTADANFDLGGFLVTVNRLLVDTAFIQKAKEEFVFGAWEGLMNTPNELVKVDNQLSKR